MATIFSIGHSNRGLDAFLALLRSNGVTGLADIRQFTRSRANPQFNAEGLARDLADAGIEYRHIPELGGRRSSKLKESQNGLWENAAFPSYADYALGEQFESGLSALLQLAAERPTAMMCAEAVWWRCHRRIVADYLLGRGHAVLHILGEAEPKPAILTPGAQIREDGKIVYPPIQPGLL